MSHCNVSLDKCICVDGSLMWSLSFIYILGTLIFQEYFVTKLIDIGE